MFIYLGKRGRGDNDLSMPVNVIVDDSLGKERVYILDPGNSRIQCLTLDGKFIEHLDTESLLESTSTGLAYRCSSSTFYLLDWKSKTISEFSFPSSDSHGQMRLHHQLTSSLFNEPVQIALFSHHLNALLICDNNILLIIDHRTGNLITRIDPRSFGMKTIKAFTVGLHDEIILADHRIHIVSYEGKYLRQISSNQQQQIVDVDVHIAHQTPDLIASHHKQHPILMHSRSNVSKGGGGGQSTMMICLLIYFSFVLIRILYGTLCG